MSTASSGRGGPPRGPPGGRGRGGPPMGRGVPQRGVAAPGGRGSTTTPTQRNSMSRSSISQPAPAPSPAPVYYDDEDGGLNESSHLLPNSEPAESKANGGMIIMYVATLVFLTTSWTVLFKHMNDTMSNYPYFLNQITVFVYIPVCFAIYFIRLKSSGDPEMSEKNAAFPKKKFMLMGILDALSGLLAFFAASNVAGPVQNILNQGIIPFTMVAARLLPYESGRPGTGYQMGHYFGAVLIFIGIFICMYPSLSSESQGTVWFWAIIFACNNIPYAVSAIYKERALKAADGRPAVDMNYLYAWMNVFNFCAGFLLAPIVLMLNGTNLRDIPGNLVDGGRCYFEGVGSKETDKNCGDAFWLVTAFITLNILTTLFMLLVMKHRNAALGFIAMAVSVPVADIAFTSEAIMGASRSILTNFDVIGLVVTVVGLVVYGYIDYRASQKKVQHYDDSEYAYGDYSKP